MGVLSSPQVGKSADCLSAAEAVARLASRGQARLHQRAERQRRPCRARADAARAVRGEREGPREVLRRRASPGRRGPRGPGGDGARPAGPQRGRQDDDDPCPDDAAEAGRGQRQRGGSRRRARRRQAAGADRAGRTVRGRRREPDRPGEPDDGGPAVRNGTLRCPAQGERAARALRPRPTRPTAW